MRESSVWKAFENNKITHSNAHYLMVIDSLCVQSGGCRAADIARELSVSRNAVSLKLQAMTRQNLVCVDANNHVHLCDAGQSAVESILASRRSFQFFLCRMLNVSEQAAEEDSCKVEHLLSEETTLQLLRLAKFMQTDSAHIAPFLAALKSFDVNCDQQQQEGCEICHNRCLVVE